MRQQNKTPCIAQKNQCDIDCSTWYSISKKKAMEQGLQNWEDYCQATCDQVYLDCLRLNLGKCNINWDGCIRFCDREKAFTHDGLNAQQKDSACIAECYHDKKWNCDARADPSNIGIEIFG